MNTKKSYLVDCHAPQGGPAMTAGSESGRTLTEMLGVLAIMGVLTIGGIAGFNWAMDRWRANRIIDGVEERALVGSRLRLSGMNRTMEIADAVVAQTGGTIEDYATTVSNTGHNNEKTYFSVQVAGVSPQVCENVMNLNWQLPVEVYAGNTQYTGDTAICAGEGTVDLTFVFAADLITKKNVQVVDRNNPTCRPTQVWTCKTNNANGYKCCTAGMLCLADGEEPSGVSSANEGNCPRGTHQCRNNQCVCRKSCPAGYEQDPKTCACSSQTCETGVWNEAKGECVECNEDTDCATRTDGKTTCDTASNVCKCPAGKVPNADGTACVECKTNADCKNAYKPVCNTANNTCVGCTEDADCAGNRICNTANNTCKCPAMGTKPTATCYTATEHAATEQCLAYTTYEPLICPEPKTECDVANNTCKCPDCPAEKMTQNEDTCECICNNNKVLNATGTRCVGCNTDADCAWRTDGRTRCGVNSHTCAYVTCRSNSDCAAGQYCSIGPNDCKDGTSGACKELGERIEFENYNLLYSSGNSDMNWMSAGNWCQANGKKLVSVDTLVKIAGRPTSEWHIAEYQDELHSAFYKVFGNTDLGFWTDQDCMGCLGSPTCRAALLGSINATDVSWVTFNDWRNKIRALCE